MPKHLGISTLNDTTVCAGSILKLTSKNTGYKTCCRQKIVWSTGDTASGISSSTYLKVEKNDTLAWVTTTDGLCSDSDFVNIFVRQAPKVSLPDSQFICLGSSAIIKPIIKLDTNIATYSLAFGWRKAGNSVLISTDTFLTVDSFGMYILTATDELGCQITDSVNLTENSSWIPKDTFTCGSDPILIELPIISGITYKWKDKTNDTATTFIGSTRIISITKPRYYRIVSVENNGRSQCEIFDSFWVDIEKKPSVQTAPKFGHLCPGSEIVFNANLPGGIWSGNGIVSNAQQLKIAADSTWFGKSVYTYTYTNAKGCSHADTSLLWIWQKPKAIIKNSDSLINLGNTKSFKSISKNTINAISSWYIQNPDTFIFNKNSIAITFNTLGPSAITFYLMDTLTQCTDSATKFFTVQKIVSLSKNSKQNIEVYPNPTTGIVRFSGLENNSTVSLFNPSGSLLYRQEISKKENDIHVSHLPKGVYFLKIETETARFTQKLILL